MISNDLILRAFNNDIEALLLLGYAYFSGEDGEKGKEQAAVFFGKAVETALKRNDAAEIEKITRFLEEHIVKSAEEAVTEINEEIMPEPEAEVEKEADKEPKDIYSDTSYEAESEVGEKKIAEEFPAVTEPADERKTEENKVPEVIEKLDCNPETIWGEEPVVTADPVAKAEPSAEDTVKRAKAFFYGENTEKSYFEAKRLFEIAAMSGNMEAKKYIAYMYINGLGGYENLMRAEQLLNEVFYSNEKEFREETGMCLADLYANRLNKMNEAVRIWEMLAMEGNANAQYNFGLALFRGIGVEADAERGVFWWKNAAEKGHKDAKHNLEILYGSRR